MKLIEQKFVSYSWNGNDVIASWAKVAWDLLSVPGGLGLRKVVDSKKAAVLRLYPFVCMGADFFT